MDHSPRPIGFDSGDSQDRRLSSLGATVEFARMNNLLGVFVDSTLLVRFSNSHFPYRWLTA